MAEGTSFYNPTWWQVIHSHTHLLHLFSFLNTGWISANVFSASWGPGLLNTSFGAWHGPWYLFRFMAASSSSKPVHETCPRATDAARWLILPGSGWSGLAVAFPSSRWQKDAVPQKCCVVESKREMRWITFVSYFFRYKSNKLINTP